MYYVLTDGLCISTKYDVRRPRIENSARRKNLQAIYSQCTIYFLGARIYVLLINQSHGLQSYFYFSKRRCGSRRVCHISFPAPDVLLWVATIVSHWSLDLELLRQYSQDTVLFRVAALNISWINPTNKFNRLDCVPWNLLLKTANQNGHFVPAMRPPRHPWAVTQLQRILRLVQSQARSTKLFGQRHWKNGAQCRKC